MQQIITPVLVRQRAPAVPDAVPAAETLQRCFAFEAEERPTAGELAEALAPEAAAMPEVVVDMAKGFAAEVARLTTERDASQWVISSLRTEVAGLLLEKESLRGWLAAEQEARREQEQQEQLYETRAEHAEASLAGLQTEYAALQTACEEAITGNAQLSAALSASETDSKKDRSIMVNRMDM